MQKSVTNEYDPLRTKLKELDEESDQLQRDMAQLDVFDEHGQCYMPLFEQMLKSKRKDVVIDVLKRRPHIKLVLEDDNIQPKKKVRLNYFEEDRFLAPVFAI